MRQKLRFLLRHRGAHGELHAPGPHRGQQLGRLFRAEEERRIGGAILHQFQQYILILHRQPAAVGENKHLAEALVGLDERLAAQGAQRLHGQILAVGAGGGDNVRVNIPHGLAAGAAAQAGGLRLPALQGGGIESSGAEQVAAPGEYHPVGELTAAACPADTALQRGIHQPHLRSAEN